MNFISFKMNDCSDGRVVGVGPVGCGAISSLSWSRDGQHLLATTEYGALIRWSLQH